MINLKRTEEFQNAPQVFNEWNQFHCETTEEMQKMQKQFIHDKPNWTALDTETDGLNVAEGGSVAFLIQFGWISETRKWVFTFHPTKENLLILKECLDQSPVVWGVNIKFDLNILKNTSPELFDNHNFKNFCDLRALWRVATDVGDEPLRTGLKELAALEIEGAKVFKDLVALSLSAQKSEHAKNFKTWCWEEHHVKLKSPDVDKIRDYDVFMPDEWLALWAGYCNNNPQPNFESVYHEEPNLVRVYGAGDIIYTLELALKYDKIVKSKRQTEAATFEHSLIIPLAEQERTGLTINIEYLLESKKQVLEYSEYISDKLNYVASDLIRNAPISDLINDERSQLLFADTTKRVGGVKRVLNKEEINDKINNYLVNIENENYMFSSVDFMKMFFFHTTTQIQKSWSKTPMSDFYEAIKERLESGKIIEAYRKQFENMLVFIDTLGIFRRVNKWANTYIGRWIKEYNYSTDGKIHPSFDAYKTTTGRMSSSFQQQPKDKLYDIRTQDDEGNYKELFSPRAMIIKSKDPNVIGVLVADLAQIEVRVNAEYTIKAGMPDKTLINSILHGSDMHSLVAAEAFHHEEFLQDKEKALALVEKSERTLAKSLNFLMQYGGSKVGIRKHPYLGKIPENVQDDLFDAYQRTRQGTVHYQRWAIEQMQTNILNVEGEDKYYVENMYGRRYYANHDWVFGNQTWAMRSNSYKAINYLIQGTCAHALKHSLVEITKFLKDNNLKSRIITNIHDEVQVEIYKGEAWIIRKIKTFMEDMPWAKTIPIKCDLEWFSDCWANKFEIEVRDGKWRRKSHAE